MGFLTAVTLVIGVLGMVAVSAVVARRLLDLRFGLVRTLIAGTLVFLIAGPLMRAFASTVDPNDPGITPLWFLILAAVSALLAGMVFLVIAEALVAGIAAGTAGADQRAARPYNPLAPLQPPADQRDPGPAGTGGHLPAEPLNGFRRTAERLNGFRQNRRMNCDPTAGALR